METGAAFSEPRHKVKKIHGDYPSSYCGLFFCDTIQSGK